MFFVFNKEKIKAYLISVSTVVILLAVSVVMQGKLTNKTVETSGIINKMPINSVKTDEKEVALSINCTKNMDNISSILDTLSKMKAKATFFVTGDIVDKYPEEVKKISNNGNEIGNMANNYSSLKNMSKTDVNNQIKECNEKINKVTSIIPKLFRTPYGEYNNTIIEVAQSQNIKVVTWNIDTLDYNELASDEICERVDENLSNGSIILTHNEYINDSLEKLINDIQQKGYKVNTVSNILYTENYEIDNNRSTVKK